MGIVVCRNTDICTTLPVMPGSRLWLSLSPTCHLLATLLTSLHPNYYCAFLTMLSLDPVPVTSESSGLSPLSPSLLVHQHYPFLSCPHHEHHHPPVSFPHLSLKMGFPLWCRPSHHTPILSLCPMPFRPLVSSGLLNLELPSSYLCSLL